MITHHCKHILKILRSKGYIYKYIRSLSGGVNSSIHLLKLAENKYCVLKIYPLPSKNDPRDRCFAETTFLNYLQSCKVYNVPEVLDCDRKNGWSLMSWINGRQVEQLPNPYLDQISNFILRTNQNSRMPARSVLKDASDSLKTLDGSVASVEKRISQLSSIQISSDTSHETILWIKTTLQPAFNSLKSKLLNDVKLKSHWLDFNRYNIASPSDMGIHNMIHCNGTLYFLDFEYAGMDDIAKLAADLILQPKLPLNAHQESYLLKCLQQNFNHIIPDLWLIRTNDLKPLFAIKWSLIMLNSLKNSSVTDIQLSNTRNYFNSVDYLMA